MKLSENDKRRNDILCSWIGSMNSFKRLPKQSKDLMQLYQNTPDIFPKTRTDTPKIYMEPQKISNCYINLQRKKKRNWKHNCPRLQTTLIKAVWWEFPGSPVVGTQHFHCRGLGLVPGWGTKICKLLGTGEKEREREREREKVLYWNKTNKQKGHRD